LSGEEECAPRLSPVIRVTPGKKYKFTLTNMAPEGNPTNIHTHGLHISGSGDADDVTRIVHGGNCLDYSKLLFCSTGLFYFSSCQFFYEGLTRMFILFNCSVGYTPRSSGRHTLVGLFHFKFINPRKEMHVLTNIISSLSRFRYYFH